MIIVRLRVVAGLVVPRDHRVDLFLLLIVLKSKLKIKVQALKFIDTISSQGALSLDVVLRLEDINFGGSNYFNFGIHSSLPTFKPRCCLLPFLLTPGLSWFKSTHL